jgi:hypothetical protein
MLLTRCGARANMLVIILLHTSYLKNKYWDNNFFISLHQNNTKTSKNINLN